MRASEFITERKSSKLRKNVAKALPATYVMPELPNQDPYLQYRFGVAIADVRGRDARNGDKSKMAATSPWGENQIIVSYGSDEADTIDSALGVMGKTEKKMISTPKSDESLPHENVVSPVVAHSWSKSTSK